jgi:hypothetical protein
MKGKSKTFKMTENSRSKYETERTAIPIKNVTGGKTMKYGRKK